MSRCLHAALTVLGQMDVGPMIPGLCELAGFIIIPTTLLAWYWLIRRRRRRESVGHAALVFAVAVTSGLCVLWLIGGIDEWLFEPKIDDTGAMFLVENLPEVRQYIDARHVNGPPREVRLDDTLHPTLPRYTLQFVVGELDEKHGAMRSIWRHFRVSLVNSDVERPDRCAVRPVGHVGRMAAISFRHAAGGEVSAAKGPRASATLGDPSVRSERVNYFVAWASRLCF